MFAFSYEVRKGQQFSSCQFDMMHQQGQNETTEKKRQTFTSRAFAKKDSVLNLCNPFVLLTHPPLIEQESLIHCRSVGSQISFIALVDLFGVISWRLSKTWEKLSNSEFQISTRGAKRGFGERNGEPTKVDTLTVAASPWDASGIKHTHKRAHNRSPPSSLKLRSKQLFVVLTWEMTGFLFVF